MTGKFNQFKLSDCLFRLNLLQIFLLKKIYKQKFQFEILFKLLQSKLNFSERMDLPSMMNPSQLALTMSILKLFIFNKPNLIIFSKFTTLFVRRNEPQKKNKVIHMLFISRSNMSDYFKTSSASEPMEVEWIVG